MEVKVLSNPGISIDRDKIFIVPVEKIRSSRVSAFMKKSLIDKGFTVVEDSTEATVELTVDVSEFKTNVVTSTQHLFSSVVSYEVPYVKLNFSFRSIGEDGAIIVAEAKVEIEREQFDKNPDIYIEKLVEEFDFSNDESRSVSWWKS